MVSYGKFIKVRNLKYPIKLYIKQHHVFVTEFPHVRGVETSKSRATMGSIDISMRRKMLALDTAAAWFVLRLGETDEL